MMTRLRELRVRLSLLIAVLALGVCLAGPVAVWASEPAGGESAAEEGHGGIPSAKIWDLVWRTTNFIVLAGVLFYVLRKPLSQGLNNRRQNIAQTLSDLEEKKAQAEAGFKELEAKLADMEAERDRIMADYIRSGEDEKNKIIAGAQDMADRIKKQAEVTIQQEISKAKEELTREIAEMSASMAEDLVRKNINDQDQQRLVEEYLNKVVQN